MKLQVQIVVETNIVGDFFSIHLNLSGLSLISTCVGGR